MYSREDTTLETISFRARRTVEWSTSKDLERR